MSNKLVWLIVGLLVVLLLTGAYIFFSYTNQAYIKDAYCDSNGHFNFTVVNTGPSDLNLTYKWHLDDPKANTPRPLWENGYSPDKFYIGDGKLTVPGDNSTTVVIPLPPDPSYPQNNLVMDVELFDGNTSIYHYREQKDTYGWDYSTLPPKRK